MCMLDGKTVFEVPNVPETAVLVRFNALFAYLYDAVTYAKGMVNLRIDMARSQTIASVMNETFPEIKCFAGEKLHVINPKIVAYIHALIIDCVSLPMDENINARALQHEASMWGVYSKMKPDSFRSQFQAVLTTYYEDIKEVQGASGCTKAKSVKRRFQDVDEAGDDAAAAAAPAADAAAASAPAAEAAAGAGAEAAEAAATPDEDPALTQEEALPVAPAPAQPESRRERAGRGPQRADAD
jgi:hypothetical protein